VCDFLSTAFLAAAVVGSGMLKEHLVLMNRQKPTEKKCSSQSSG
jgi:hypothetical protein